MIYNQYSFLYPPKPDQAISSTMLTMVENQKGMIAQIKKNGACNVIAISPDKKIITKNRHGEDHKAWVPDNNKLKALTSLSGGWYVFVAELLHSKVSGIRDVNYIHDVLVADGKYLVGVTHYDRQKILKNIFNINENHPSTYSHYEIDKYTWAVKEHHHNFKKLFDSLDRPEDEGIVIKRSDIPLKLCTKSLSNNLGMLKARKPHKNYSF